MRMHSPVKMIQPEILFTTISTQKVIFQEKLLLNYYVSLVFLVFLLPIQFKQARSLNKKYKKSLNFLLKSSKRPGTWDNYKTKQKHWLKFCRLWHINPYIKHSQEIYTYFVIWRYETTKNKHSTISQDVSAVISLYNSSTVNNPIDRTNWSTLRGVLKGIERQPGRQSEVTNPIRNVLLLQIIKRYNSFNFYNALWKSIICFGKNFALRTAEYIPKTSLPTITTIRWKDLNFHKYNNAKHLSFTLRSSKTNTTYKIEIITRKCLCNNHKLRTICAVCNLWTYRKFYKTIFKIRPNSCAFLNLDGSLVTSEQYLAEFKLALADVGITAKYPIWRPHSLRKGEISDLVAACIPFELL